MTQSMADGVDQSERDGAVGSQPPSSASIPLGGFPPPPWNPQYFLPALTPSTSSDQQGVRFGPLPDTPHQTAASSGAARSGAPGGSGVTTGWRMLVVGAAIGALVATIVGGGIAAVLWNSKSSDQSSATTSTAGRAVSPSGPALDIRTLLEKVRPSVVTIRTDPGLAAGTGSGIVVDEQGTVLTNAHVINAATEIEIEFSNGDLRPAVLVGSFPERDVALVRPKEPRESVPAELGDSSTLQVGDDVVAIGNALNLGGDPSVTKGIVSALNRELDAEGEHLDQLIQTDAAINLGNSGGPLLNAEGRVVGVNTAIIANSQSLGFALAIDSLKPLMQKILNGEAPVDGDGAFLGVVTTDVGDQPADVLDQFKVDVEHGAFVARVQAGSGADRGSIIPGDILTSIGDEAVETKEDVGRILAKHKPDDRVTIAFERDGEEQSVEIVLGRRGG